jgi:hypothetical protein
MSLPFPRLRRALRIIALLAPIGTAAQAAELDGVQLPNMLEVGGQRLLLNGIGLRTYSILSIHIYVAGLYLERLDTDADAILRSNQTKLLTIRFEHDISVDSARNAWRTGLDNNCKAPCRLDPEDVTNFLAEVPAMHVGETFAILFTTQGATVTVDGHRIGVISKRSFADAMLATFLGPVPASSSLKAALLQGHE